MRAPSRRLQLVLAFALTSVPALMAACGGNVVVDHGAGGAGGDGTTSTTTTTHTGTTTVTTTVTTTSTGPTGCDAIGICGEQGGGCVDCALNGVCAGVLNACLNNPQCLDYADCINACSSGDQACLDLCAMQLPGGAGIYNALIGCAICNECYVSCDGPSWGCP